MTFDERWNAILTDLTDTVGPLVEEADAAEAARVAAVARAEDAESKLAAEKALHEATRVLLTTEQKKMVDHMALTAPAGHSTTTTPTPQPPAALTKAQQSIGVQVFPDRLDLSYGKDLTGTFNALKALGVKKVRGGVGPALTDTVINWYNKCYDELGIKVMFTVGKPREPFTTAEWDATAAKLAKIRGIEMLTNWNEPNHNRNGTGPSLTGWQKMTIDHGAELKRRFGAKYKIGSAQLWSGNLDTQDADLKSLAAATGSNSVKYKDTFDTIVWHLYQQGLTPFNRYKTLYTQLFGALPIVCSETGMSTAPNQAQGAAAMTEAGQADYIVKHLKMYLDNGAKAYWFELRDEPDPEGTDREDWLGIVRADGSYKPAFAALKNLLATP